MAKNRAVPALVVSVALNLLLGGVAIGWGISQLAHPRSDGTAAVISAGERPAAVTHARPSSPPSVIRSRQEPGPVRPLVRSSVPAQATPENVSSVPVPSSAAGISSAPSVPASATSVDRARSVAPVASGESTTSAAPAGLSRPRSSPPVAPTTSLASLPNSGGGGVPASLEGGASQPGIVSSTVQSVGTIPGIIDPAAPGNSVHFEGYRVAVESVEPLEDGSDGLSLVLTPEAAPTPAASRQRGFTEEQLIFRQRWGEEAYKQAQLTARSVANGN